jgi:hypothetical protein
MSQISRLRDAEISNGNLINADDIDAELNQLVSESNSQDTRLGNLESSAMTIAGVKTFSSAPKTDQIDERTLNAGVSIDSVLHKDGAIQLLPTAAYTPSANGELGYDSTTHAYKVVENGVAKSINTTVNTVSAKSSSYTALTTDKGALFLCTGTFTLSFTAAATLGSGWFCDIRNDGTGMIALDPNASETINGQTSINVYPGEAFRIVCDGSGFKTIGRMLGWIPLQSQTANNVASVNFTSFINSDFDMIHLRLEDVTATSATGVNPWLRVSTDGGSSWKQGASDYGYSAGATDNGFTGSNSNGDTKLLLTYAGSTNGQLTNTANQSLGMDLYIARPSATAQYHKIWGAGSMLSSTPRHVGMLVGGAYNAVTAVNGLQILMSGGNLSGVFYLNGYRRQ